MIFSRIFKGFWAFLTVLFASIFRRYSCFWRNFENCWLLLMVFFTYFWQFLMVLNGFRYILSVFLRFLMVFDVFATVFYDFLRIFDEFSCFLYYFWRLRTHYWRSVLFFEIFFVGFDGFNQFLTYLGCFGQVFDDFLTVFYGFRRFSIVFEGFHWFLDSFRWFFIYLWHLWTVFDDFWRII